MAKSMGKTIASVVILSAVTLSAAAGIIGIKAMTNNPSPESSVNPGDDENQNKQGIEKIEKTKTMGQIDEFTITYGDDSTSRILVTNGPDGPTNIQGMPDSTGHIPTVSVGSSGNWVIDGKDSGIRADGLRDGTPTKTVVSVTKKDTVGNTDIYEITYSDDSKSDFLFNSEDNEIHEFAGSDGHTPTIAIGDNGNWFVDWNDTGIFAKSGAAGGNGKSAYEIAVEKGFSGTPEEWLLSLVGPAGGNGKSAYQTAVDNGYTGTETEWLTSLMGQDGQEGLSAYQIYKENNIDPDLSEPEWLASLNGKSAYQSYCETNPGPDLSESEWLESLVGHSGSDGRGIASIAGPTTDGKYDTYTINYTDGSAPTQFVVTNGEDGKDGAALITGVSDPLATDGKSGDSYINTTTWEYFTKNGSDWESKGSIRGAGGANGTNGLDGKSLLTGDGVPGSDLGTAGDSYIDLSSGDYYVNDGTDWEFKVNVRGEEGKGITTIALTDGSEANRDKYTITYSDGSSTDFYVAKPRSIETIVKTSTDENVDTYTITYNYGEASTFTVTNGINGQNGLDGRTIYHGETAPDNSLGAQDDVYINTSSCEIYFKGMTEWGTPVSFKGTDGRGITSITGPEKVGLVDTYTINYSDSTTSTFTVTNGANGKDGTKVVAGTAAPAETDGFQKGDSYINTSNGDYYVLIENASEALEWELRGNIQGAAGSNGLNGTKLVTGDADPSATDGYQEGDSFLNTSSWDYFVLTKNASEELEWSNVGNIHNSPNRYTVTFESNGGSEVASVDDAMEGRKLVKPTDPTKSGYFFQGWFTEDGTKWDFYKDVVTDDLNLFARWGQLEVTNGIVTGCTLTGDVEIPYIYDGQIIEGIAADVFSNRSDITSLVLPNTITELPDSAFEKCTYLTEITLPSSIIEIPSRAFFGCTRLASFVVPSKVETIGAEAFSGCTKIEAISLPKSVITIGDSAFKGCSKLSDISTVSNADLAIIETHAFENCTSLRTLVLPDYVTNRIGEGAFKGCTNLNTLNMVSGMFGTSKNYGLAYLFDGTSTPYSLQNVTFRGKSSYSQSLSATHFAGCSSILNLTVGSVNTVYLDDGALAPLTKIKSLTLPQFGMYNGAFIGMVFGNTSEEELNSTVPATLETIRVEGYYSYGDYALGMYAFTNCSHVKQIILGKHVAYINSSLGVNSALKGCTALEYLETPFLGTGYHQSSTKKLCSMFGYSSFASIPESEVPQNLKEVVLTEGNYKMDTLDGNAFDGWSQIKKITLNSGIRSIGTYTFRNCGVEDLYIPNSVTSFVYGDGENFTFRNSGLKSIRLPENSSFNEIKWSLFKDCTELESIVIPNNVKKIGVGAFEGCTKLRSVTLPNALTSIANDAFKGCASLKTIEIPSTVTTFGTAVFQGCSKLTYVSLPDGMTSIPNDTFALCLKLNDVVIPDGVTTIGERAFASCLALNSITLPDHLTTIGIAAFVSCQSLSTISLPDTLTTIGDYAFAYSGVRVISGLDDFAGFTRTVGVSAFNSCPITSLTLHLNADSKLELGISAFTNCTGLTLVSFKGDASTSVYDIKGTTFKGTAIASLDITGFGTLNFAGGDFREVETLNIIRIEKTLSSADTLTVTFGTDSFNGCYGLLSVDIYADEVNVGDRCFQYCRNLRAFKGTSGIIVKTIGDSAFYGCRLLDSDFLLLRGVTSIGTQAFYECSSLKKITLPNTITSLGQGMFRFCTSLTYLAFPNNPECTQIPDYVASGLKSLTEVVIPNNITTVGFYSFNGTGLKVLDLPDSVTSISDYAFGSCVDLEQVKLPENPNFKTIGYYVFDGCVSLESIRIPWNVKTISSNSFRDCIALTTFTLIRGTDENYIKINIMGDALTNCPISVVNFSGTRDQYQNLIQFAYIEYGCTVLRDLDNPEVTFTFDYVE